MKPSCPKTAMTAGTLVLSKDTRKLSEVLVRNRSSFRKTAWLPSRWTSSVSEVRPAAGQCLMNGYR